MSEFKGRHFAGEIVLWAVRWYCRYAPEIEKRLRWQWRRPCSTSWRIDEIHVKVRGRWAHLYRALDKHGNTIDFHLSLARNTASPSASARR